MKLGRLSFLVALACFSGALSSSVAVDADVEGPDPAKTPGEEVYPAGGADRFVPAGLPNGMTMRLPSNVLSAELPYALDLAGNDLQAFASTAASLSSNPALASAAHAQAQMKTQISSKISALENNVIARQKVVATALYEVQRAVRVLSLAQREAYVARSALATSHRQLAALDVNSRRLADAARLADLQRALSLTTSTLVPGAVLTATQRVVNAQLAASLRDQIARTQARIAAASEQIDSILAANDTAAAVEHYHAAEKHEGTASTEWSLAQRERAEADRVNTARAHVLASKAHIAVNQAGQEAGSGKMKDDHKKGGDAAAAAHAAPAAAHAAGPSPAAPPPPAAPPAAFKQKGLGDASESQGQQQQQKKGAAAGFRFASADLAADLDAESTSTKGEAASGSSNSNLAAAVAHVDSQSTSSAPLMQGAALDSVLGASSTAGLGAGAASGAAAGMKATSGSGSGSGSSALRHNRAASGATGQAEQRRVAQAAESQSQSQAQAAAQARIEAGLQQAEKISSETRLHRSAEQEEAE